MLPDPLLVWGIFPRLLGIVYFIALAPLYAQIVPIAGEKGIAPVGQVLRRMRRDLPLWRRLLHFPSLLWLSSSDRFLRAVVLVGSGAALLVVVGGPVGRGALVVCWLVWLSLQDAVDLHYPWDCLLFEAGFLALFLPTTLPLPSLATTELPFPIVVIAYQILLVRLLWGFGKFKFMGTTRKDHGYLKDFLIFQPVPTRLGWYAYHLPDVFHRLGLLLLFAAEVPLPLLAFVPGPARLVLVAATATLMLGIQLMCNFGYFNVMVLVLLVPLLDLNTWVGQLSLATAFASWESLLVHATIGFLILGSVLFFPFNSWAPYGWLYWPVTLTIRSRLVRGVFSFFRGLSGLRLLHGYGVFPPQPIPAVKFIPVIEGSLDGVTWRAYEYAWMPTTESSPPRAFAPYHPRWDHLVLYEGMGMNESGYLASMAGSYNPYRFSRHPWLWRVMQRLMQPDSPVRTMFRNDPFQGRAPRFMRATLVALMPTSIGEQRRTGRWWRAAPVDVHMAPIEADATGLLDWPNGPELFHWDDIVWRRRVPWFRGFEAAARAATDLRAIEDEVVRALGLSPATMQRFWGAFIPGVQPTHRKSWCELPAAVSATRARFGQRAMHDFERIAMLLSLALAARFESRIFGDPAERLPLPSYFHVGMLMHRLVLGGRDMCEEALQDATFVKREAGQLEPALGLWLWGLFRPETMASHTRANRLMLKFMGPDVSPIVPGFALVGPFLAEQFIESEAPPRIEAARAIADGAWQIYFPDLHPTDRAERAGSDVALPVAA
jgi:hypothetical protein